MNKTYDEVIVTINQLEKSIASDRFKQLSKLEQLQLELQLEKLKNKISEIENEIPGLYLSEMMQDIKLNKNQLIISPTGSGKTHYIFNDLIKKSKGRLLYLCDNSNLKSQIISDYQEYLKDNQDNKCTLTIKTYSGFSEKVKLTNEYIKEFDIVVCDEIHSLVEYNGFGKSNLSHAIKELFKEYDNTQIMYLTATPDYLEKLKKDFESNEIFQCILNNAIDFSENEEIKRYIENSKYYINNIQQIGFHIKAREQAFKYRNLKGLAFTSKITEMEKIENILKDLNHKPICIWSINNSEKPLNNEQLRVREHLINTGQLLSPYNFLIINKSTETGVNIKDRDMRLAIINSTVPTEITQVRGRLRHDVDLLIVKTDEKKLPDMKITLDKKWLDKELTTEMKNDLCKELNIINEKNQISTWRSVKPRLIKNRYEIKRKQITENNKRIWIEIITKSK